MRKIYFLIFLFFMSALTQAQLISNASNTTQLTGGNYVFVQDGKLTFNLDENLFENRTWTFDEGSDHAKTEFSADLPLKTKHSSEFHGYEIAKLKKNNFHVVVLNDRGMTMLVRPVYKKNQQGRYIKTWIPAAIGWVTRVGGAIARSVLPPIITNLGVKCIKNHHFCASLFAGIGITAAELCVINYSGDGIISRIFRLPKGICEEAEQDGFKKNPTTGQYEKTATNSNTPFQARWKDLYSGPKGRPGTELVVQGGHKAASSLEEAKRVLENQCQSLNGRQFTSPNVSFYGDFEKATVIEIKPQWNGNHFKCHITVDLELGGQEKLILEGSVGENKQVLTMVDITNFAAKDFKRNPNPYINDKGEVGKELKKNIKPYAYISKGNGENGNLTAVGNIYTDPKTGVPKQDIVNITAVNNPNKPADVPPISSGGSGGISGSSGSSPNSPILNTVGVSTIDRPDRKNEATTAQNNAPNGTNPNPSNGEGQGNGSSSGNGKDGKDGKDGQGFDCEKNKDTLACEQMGEVNEQGDNLFNIPKIDAHNNKGYEPDNFMPKVGTCPSPKPVSIMGKQYYISYDWLCRFAKEIRMIIIGLAYLMAGYIIFSGRKE